MLPGPLPVTLNQIVRALWDRPRLPDYRDATASDKRAFLSWMGASALCFVLMYLDPSLPAAAAAMFCVRSGCRRMPDWAPDAEQWQQIPAEERWKVIDPTRPQATPLATPEQIEQARVYRESGREQLPWSRTHKRLPRLRRS